MTYTLVAPNNNYLVHNPRGQMSGPAVWDSLANLCWACCLWTLGKLTGWMISLTAGVHRFPSTWPLILRLLAWAHLHGGFNKKSKPQSSSAIQVSACVTVSNVSLAKASHKANPDSRGAKIDSTS